jgi:hypothetical protein
MSYSPINVQAYTSAYSGAISGMAVSGWITDPTSSDYSQVATIAGAFAESFDQAWNSATALDNLEIQTIGTVCQQEFKGRAPAPFAAEQYSLPATWANAAAACVALVRASEAFFVGQGITPPSPSGGTPFGPKETFTATGTFTVPASITGALFEGCGGGGGGGGGAGFVNADTVGGGGGGGAQKGTRSIALTPGDVITVTIGPGGAGGTAGAAGAEGDNGLIGGDTIISSAAHGELFRFRGASGGMAANTNGGVSYGGSSVTNSNGNGHTNYQVFEYTGTTANNGSIGNDATGGNYGTFGTPGSGGASGGGYSGFPGADSLAYPGGGGGVGGPTNSSCGGGGGGGGGYGAGANGGAAGLSGSPGTAPVAGSAAAANTGGGGGGGGGGYSSASVAQAGAAGGLGGSGFCVVSW